MTLIGFCAVPRPALAMIQVRFDDISGELRRISGDLGPAQGPEMIKTTIEKYRALFSDPRVLAGLRFTKLTFGDGIAFYQFQQTYEGLEVFGSSLTVSVSNGRLQALTSELKPNVRVDTHPAIAREEAERVARSTLRAEEGEAQTKLIVYARSEQPVLAYAVALDCKTVVIDARTARVLEVDALFNGRAAQVN
ncbi:hypothetical protein [Gloeobacter kilaueensis]|uniref:hypothetical protein n=1 Tax=Gloeobacter kilaueensis TaxID=1416614 RepID=UPI000420C673|nr:hypothetical protein [Gloeobacter kilaueensis]